MATLIALTNTPSDNFFAETLLKDIGATLGAGGTTAAGAAVVRSTSPARSASHPRFDDGSGLSDYDRTSPAQVVSLLRTMAGNVPFTQSLATAGETGTLVDEMTGHLRSGTLPRQDRHAARRLERGRLLHGAATATCSPTRS